ncbi:MULTISPECIES: hypothetical protein [Mucilaginibacter]|uniref:hypothetical protein n=1 Tax=Mucilaginibacter TaxID=423349 RepID=UPI002093F663|nr:MULTISPECIES: hypothetical protein [Mucilaginibacter]MCO5945789.1 hypothetical protein [Mucilaginibacter flavidus]
METKANIDIKNREISQIKANSEDEYWAKKYNVSAEELKETGNALSSIQERILKITTKNKSFSF